MALNQPTSVGTEILFPKPTSLTIGILSLSVPYIEGKFDWGKINTPIEIINETELLEKYHGGAECFLQAQVLFRFYQVRKIVLNRLGHYTDPTDKLTLDALQSSAIINDQAAVPAAGYIFKAKNHGSDGDFVSVTTRNSSKINTTTTAILATTEEKINLTNVDLIEIGEILFIDDTTTSVYVKIKNIIGNDVYFDAVTLGASIASGAIVTSLNFEIDVKFKGAIVKQYTDLSSEAENKAEYVILRLKADKWIIISTEPTLSVIPEERRPAVVTDNFLAGGSNGGTLIEADYIGNEGIRTGIYALELYGNGKLPVLITVPDLQSALLHKAIIAFCEDKKIHYFIGEFPFGYDDDDCIDFCDNVAQINTEFAAYYYPNVLTEDPDIAGLQVPMHISGHICGRFSLTDEAPNEGPWQVSAGETFGVLRGILGLEEVTKNGELVVLTDDVNVREKLRAAKINPVYKLGLDYLIEGSFNRAKGRKVVNVHINQTRTLQYVGATVDFFYSGIVFLNHDTTLENKVRVGIQDFVDELPTNALLGQSPDQRRKIVCGPQNNKRDPNDPSVLLEPEDLWVDIFLSLQTPLLRAHWRLSKKIGE